VGRIRLEITMSLDGFSAGANVRIDNPLGDHGQRLHDWLFRGASGNDIDRQMTNEFMSATGAFILGRRTFDVGVGLWGEDGAFGKPCFVLTHRAEAELVKGPTSFTFVTDGIESALKQAQAVAGAKDVCVMGGAAVMQQYLKARLADELHIHIANILLGGGTRLFGGAASQPVALETMRVSHSPLATHLAYRIVK